MASHTLPALRIVLLLPHLSAGISARGQEGYCFSLHLVNDGSTVDAPTPVTVLDKTNHQTLPERDAKQCLPDEMAALEMLDFRFIRGDHRFYLSRIRTSAFGTPWHLEFGGRKHTRLTGLPKPCDPKRSCTMTFRGGEPKTVMITSPCRFPANTPIN